MCAQSSSTCQTRKGTLFIYCKLKVEVPVHDQVASALATADLESTDLEFHMLQTVSLTKKKAGELIHKIIVRIGQILDSLENEGQQFSCLQTRCFGNVLPSLDSLMMLIIDGAPQRAGCAHSVVLRLWIP